MGMRLYVGNLSFNTTEQELQDLFETAGQVASVNVMRDMATGRARGFAFVEMASDADAQNAIAQLQQPRSRRSQPDGQRSQAAPGAFGRLRRRRRRQPAARAPLVAVVGIHPGDSPEWASRGLPPRVAARAVAPRSSPARRG